LEFGNFQNETIWKFRFGKSVRCKLHALLLL
jgi:hypothetical protein